MTAIDDCDACTTIIFFVSFDGLEKEKKIPNVKSCFQSITGYHGVGMKYAYNFILFPTRVLCGID